MSESLDFCLRRELDSNFQYAGGVNLFVALLCRTRLLGTGRCTVAGSRRPKVRIKAKAATLSWLGGRWGVYVWSGELC